MKFFWEFFAVAINLFYIGTMYISQRLDRNLPPRRSIITNTRQKFLYMQDFYTLTYGDILGISSIAIGFAHLTVSGYVSAYQWIYSLVIGAVSTLLFAKICLRVKHKPDMGFPSTGRISWIGAIHFIYFFAGVTTSTICAWNLITGKLTGPLMWTVIAGGGFYIICCILDFMFGNFDSLSIS
ncbi:MAG: hypothetical protein WAV15_02635 [Minisyncoccia bacterium]